MPLIESVRQNYWYQYINGEARRSYEFSGRTNILGFHGTFGGWHSDGLRKYMKEYSIPGKLVHLGFFTREIDSYLPRVDAEIKERPGSILIGFSAGGILLLRYAQLNGWEGFEKIITVATPFSPLPLAEKLKKINQLAKDFSSDGPMLTSIKDLRPPQGKVISVFPKADWVTPNPKDLTLNWPTVYTDAKGHGELQEHSLRLENILDCELGIRK